MMHKVFLRGFPTDEVTSGMLWSFHVDIVRMQRWDLSTASRLSVYICLN